MSLDASALRADFPIFSRWDGARPLAYLDNAATTHKPVAVLEAERSYYECSNANVHRSVHTLGERATELYEFARERVAGFLGATDPAEVVFVRNTTEGVNLVAQADGGPPLGRGDHQEAPGALRTRDRGPSLGGPAPPVWEIPPPGRAQELAQRRGHRHRPGALWVPLGRDGRMT